MKEKRDEIIILRLTKTEKNRIYEKMFSMGIRSLSAYIRKMALDGYCLRLDLKELQRMAYLLQMCSNNLNQYAKRANECGKIYSAPLPTRTLRNTTECSTFPSKIAPLPTMESVTSAPLLYFAGGSSFGFVSI